MRVEPAHVDQVVRARDGRMVLIDADAGGVAAELRRIDPHLKVRFAESGNPPFWAVYEESDDGRSTHLVLTQQAHLTASGVWAGLDHRIVRRVMEIGSSSYDYPAEVERASRDARRARQAARREELMELGERAAHATRKDLGSKRRAFIE